MSVVTDIFAAFYNIISFFTGGYKNPNEFMTVIMQFFTRSLFE